MTPNLSHVAGLELASEAVIAAGNNTTLRDLIIEAVTNYTIPHYQKEVR